MDGILCIDKPQEFTSFDVVAVVRGAARTRRAGHTGTLDPMATGVLPVLIGRATRAIPLLPDSDKAYEAHFRLGVTTNTLDIWGQVCEQKPVCVGAEQVIAASRAFVGEIEQIPPMFSAVRKDGVRLYDLARQGIEVERAARTVRVDSLEIGVEDEKNGEYTMAVRCSSGTYIRALIHDLGQQLGCGAVMTALRRTSACGFSIADCVTLDRLREAGSEEAVARLIRPVSEVFASLREVTVTQPQRNRFVNGGFLSLTRLTGDWNDNGERVRVVDSNGEFLGIGETDRSEMMLRVVRVLV